MLSSYRHKRILDALAATGQLEVTVLAGQLGCSEKTIRRDLEHLEGAGRLQRVHGGAIRTVEDSAVPVEQRFGRDQKAKQVIAGLAAERIAEGSLVFLGAGSTTLATAARLAAGPPITAVTNMIDIAQTLDRGGRHRVFLAGGELAATTHTMRGPETLQFIGARLFDVTICGTTGIDADYGLMGPTDWHVAYMELLLRRTHCFMVVAAASKFGQQDRYHVCELSDIDVLVTNRAPNAAATKRLKESGVDLVHP